MRAAFARYEREDWLDRHARKHIKDGICIDPVLHGLDAADPATFTDHVLADFRPFHGERPRLPALGKDRP